MELLQGEAFENLFKSFAVQAFHLEVQDSHSTSEESGPFRLFLNGEPDDYSWHRPWLDLVTDTSRRGRLIRRVRVVTVPHVDYTRWGLQVAPLNIAAGEDIRWLPRQSVGAEELPADDFWLFDDRLVVFTVFEPSGQFAGGAASDDQFLVDRSIAIRERLWAAAIPYSEYAEPGSDRSTPAMSSSVQQLRQALGNQLREIRLGAGLSGRELAARAGWHSSKVSKIEYGRQAPSESDIQVWCLAASALHEVPDLVATIRHIQSMHLELAPGSQHRQQAPPEGLAGAGSSHSSDALA